MVQANLMQYTITEFQGSRRLRLHGFLDIRNMKGARLSALGMAFWTFGT